MRSKLANAWLGNPIGLRAGDLSRKRMIDGLSYTQSAVIPKKKDALRLADNWRGHGVRVRVIKMYGGYGLYTR